MEQSPAGRWPAGAAIGREASFRLPRGGFRGRSAGARRCGGAPAALGDKTDREPLGERIRPISANPLDVVEVRLRGNHGEGEGPAHATYDQLPVDVAAVTGDGDG